MTRLYNKAVRSLSFTPEKQSARIKLEQTDEKGGIKLMMQKVVVPFIAYLQRITQDYETYQRIISKTVE